MRRYHLLVALAFVVVNRVTFAGPVTKSGIPLPAYTQAVGAELHLRKAFELFKLNKTDECRARLAIAFENHPNLPPVDLMMAQLLLRNNRVQEGRQLLESAAVAYPDHPEVYLAFADQALSESRLSDAALNIQKAAGLAPPAEWSTAQKASLVEHLFQRRVLVAERRGDWKQAEQVLAKWSTMKPMDHTIRGRYAKALFHVGKTESAMKELEQVESADDKAIPAEVFMAGWYAKEQDFAAAAKLLESRLARNPNDARVLTPLAHLRLLQGDAANAWTLATKAAEGSDETTALKLLRGAIARRLDKRDIALELANSVYQESPDNFEASNLLAELLADSADPQQRRTALQLAESNVRQYPNSAASLSTLGWVCYLDNRLPIAEQLLNAARRKSPRDPQILYRLGMVYEKQGKPDRANEMRNSLKAYLKENTRAFADRTAAKQWVETPEGSVLAPPADKP